MPDFDRDPPTSSKFPNSPVTTNLDELTNSVLLIPKMVLFIPQ